MLDALRRAVQLGAVARHDLTHLGLPLRGSDLVLEGFFQHIDHDRWGGRSTWRGTQQASNGAVLGVHNLGTQLQHTAFLGITLDDLHTLAGLPQAPVFFLGVREVLLERVEAVVIRHHQLACQILDQRILLDANLRHRPHVMGRGGRQQVEVRALLEELGRERREWAKQDHALAVQHTGVQVRYGHGRCAGRSNTVGLGHVLHGDVLVLGYQKRATHREARVFACLRDVGFLQQLQRAATGTDEHEFGIRGMGGAVFQILVLDVPAAVFVARDLFDFARQFQVEVRLGLQCGNVLASDFTPVGICTDRRPGGGDLLLGITPFHHQWDPLLDLRLIFAVLHAREQWAALQCLVAFLEELDVIVAPHEAHVWRRVDERMRVFQHARLDLPSHELTSDLERLVDLDRLGDFDLAVLAVRRVVGLGQSRVARTGVVPAVGAFFGDAVQAFDHFHGPARLELIEPYAQSGAHDAAANQ